MKDPKSPIISIGDLLGQNRPSKTLVLLCSIRYSLNMTKTKENSLGMITVYKTTEE